MGTFDKGDVKAVLNKADGKEAVNYAFGLGKTQKDHGFLVHKTTKPSQLKKQLEGDKKAGYSKVGCGTIVVSNGTLTIHQDKPVTKIATEMKKAFKENGLTSFDMALPEASAPAPAPAATPAAEPAGESGGDAASSKPEPTPELKKAMDRLPDMKKRVREILADLNS